MKRTVSVSGYGAVRVAPDTAVVRVAAAHRAAGVAEAFAGVDSAITAMGEVARRFTDATHIGSSDLTVWPAFDNEGRAAGFEARHGLVITVADLTAAGALLTALATEVGDRLTVDGVSLEVADPGPAQALARERAFADARLRAEHLAGLGGAALGEVVSVVEGVSFNQPMGGAETGVALRASKDMDFEPGERSLGAGLTVTWRLL